MSKSEAGTHPTKMGEPEDDQRLGQLEAEIQRLKSAVEELTVLNDLAIAASTSLEVDQMLDTIVQKSIKAVKAEQGSILLVTDQQDAPLKTLLRQADRRSRIMTYKVGINITGWVLKHQQPLVIEDLATDSRFHTTEQERREIKSVLCVPVRFKAQLLGVLTVTNRKTPEPFTASDVRLLSIIAAQSGQLIRNSQLQAEALQKKRIEHELQMARRIQLGLLPKKVPDTKSLEISAYCNPAEEVGGDYYDYFPLADEHLGIVLADVSGHGAAAALVMTMVKGILHSISQKFESSARLLAEMNEIINRIAPRDMFVTMIFLDFDLKNRLLRYSNAGHSPLLCYDSQSQTCQMVELRGPALGLSERSLFQEKTVPFNSGDFFLIYTDGVTEAFNDQGEMFEEARLVQAAAEMAVAGAGRMLEHLRTKLREFSGKTPQSDDVAMIGIKIV